MVGCSVLPVRLFLLLGLEHKVRLKAWGKFAWIQHPYFQASRDGPARDVPGRELDADMLPDPGPAWRRDRWMDGGGWGVADTIALVSATRLLHA